MPPVVDLSLVSITISNLKVILEDINKVYTNTGVDTIALSVLDSDLTNLKNYVFTGNKDAVDCVVMALREAYDFIESYVRLNREYIKARSDYYTEAANNTSELSNRLDTIYANIQRLTNYGLQEY